MLEILLPRSPSLVMRAWFVVMAFALLGGEIYVTTVEGWVAGERTIRGLAWAALVVTVWAIVVYVFAGTTVGVSTQQDDDEEGGGSVGSGSADVPDQLKRGGFMTGIEDSGTDTGIVRAKLTGANIVATEQSQGLSVEDTAIRSHVEPFRFDCKSLIFNVESVDLTHRDEGYVDFGLSMTNLSGRRVKIHRLEGTTLIAGNECVDTPVLPNKSFVSEPNTGDTRIDFKVRQKITETVQLAIGQLDGTTVADTWVRNFNLSSLSVVGTYEDGTGERPLPDNCLLLRVTFSVRGPLDENDMKSLFRLPTTFASNRRYDGNGTQKQPDAREPLVEIDPDGTMQRLKITNRGPRDRFRVKVEQLDGTEEHETAYDLPWRGHEDDLWLELNMDEPGTVDVVDRTMPHFGERDGGPKTIEDAMAGRNSVLFQSRGQAAFLRTLVKDQRVLMKIVVYPEGSEGGTERLYGLWFEPVKQGYQIHFEEVNPR